MSIYQHFREDEREFIDQVLEWKRYVEDQYAPKLSDFLDPRQQLIVKSIIGNSEDIKIQFSPDREDVERKRVLLFPAYFQPSCEDFNLQLFEVEYPSKFVQIEHRQVLGSLMSIGVRREKFGDIIINQSRIQLIVAKEMADYLRLQLTQIGKVNVILKEIPFERQITSEEQWNAKTATASSLRLDVLLATIHNISRQKAQALIKAGVVKVNWKPIENPAFELEEGDVLSTRGFGRSKLLSIEGKTKKDKYRIEVGILK